MRSEAQKRADRAREKRGRPGWSGLLRLSPEHDAKLQQIMLPDETRQETLRRLIEKETKMNAYQRVFEQATQSAYDNDEAYVIGLELYQEGEWIYRLREDPTSESLYMRVVVDGNGPVPGYQDQHEENLAHGLNAEEMPFRR